MSRIKNLKYSSVEVTTNVANTVDAFLSRQQVVSLGPAYSTMALQDVDNNLRLHRATKKWEIPSAASSKIRRLTSIEKMLKSDAEGLTELHLGTCAYTRIQLNRMRFNLQKHVNRHYRFRSSNLRMPKGETEKSARGDVSMVAKLRDVSQWRCTSGGFELAAQVLYDVPALKRCAKSHFIPYSRKEVERLNDSFSESPNRGFEIFKCRLLDFVTFVDGMRLETVPKDNDNDRVIGCEPLLNMIAQSVIEEGIRSLIGVVYGIDLDTSQTLHHHLISDLQNATIDFRNASNSSYMAVLDWCLSGTDLHRHMCAARSPSAIFDNQNYLLNMVSPMGNGFTFGYMTLIILALSREYDSFAHVFGDDLIIDKDVAPQCLQALSVLGYHVNDTKSFISGSFRESCGAFWSFDHYVLSYDFEYPTDIVSAIVLTNKIGILAQECQGQWVQLHAELLLLFPAYHYGWHEWSQSIELDTPEYSYSGSRSLGSPAPQFDIISSYVVAYERKYMRKKRTCSVSRDLWQTKTAKDVKRLQEIQYKPTEVSLCVMFMYQEDTYRHVPQDNVTPPWLAYYLWSGRCLAPTRRVPSSKRKVKTRSELVSYWSA